MVDVPFGENVFWTYRTTMDVFPTPNKHNKEWENGEDEGLHDEIKLRSCC
jgi:hypothetical protein